MFFLTINLSFIINNAKLNGADSSLLGETFSTTSNHTPYFEGRSCCESRSYSDLDRVMQ